MDEREKLKWQIDGLFANAPVNRAIFELREELLANSLERYEDLVGQGMSEQDALQSVIVSIGNVDELIAALPEEDRMGTEWDDHRKEKTALVMAVSVGLYIFAGIVFLTGVFFNFNSLLMLVIAAAICIIPTCMLVYNSYRWPTYKKKEDTVVENFKEWNSDVQKTKSLRGAASSVLWTFILILYFVISFVTGAWYITWVLFLVCACCESLLTLLFRLRELRK